MNRNYWLLALPVVVLLSCNSNKNRLLGKWRGVKMENADMDTFFSQSQRYIDTIGNNNNPATNSYLYGVTNMDSLRKQLQIQHDSAQAMQQNSVKNTVFHFMADHSVVVIFNGAPDTGKWMMEGDSVLVVEETRGEHKGVKTKMKVTTLTDKELKLRFEQQNVFSTVTFNKE